LGYAQAVPIGPRYPDHDVPTGGVIVTSDYSNLTSGAITGRLGRVGKSGERGRARMSIDIVAEPLVHNFDELALGKPVALAIQGALQKSIRGITTSVGESTAFTRKYQEAAYARGDEWALARFGGPRLGERPPRPGNRTAWNHSGTFADGLYATENRTEKSWSVNVTNNRLDPRTSRNATEFAFITDSLRRLVPEFDSPELLARHPEVNAAIDESIQSMIFKASAMRDRKRSQLLLSALSALRIPGTGLVRTVLGE
jgi:hypothetical protein